MRTKHLTFTQVRLVLGFSRLEPPVTVAHHSRTSSSGSMYDICAFANQLSSTVRLCRYALLGPSGKGILIVNDERMISAFLDLMVGWVHDGLVVCFYSPRSDSQRPPSRLLGHYLYCTPRTRARNRYRQSLLRSEQYQDGIHRHSCWPAR